MKHLEIDLETYSSVDLKKSGVYKYAESDDFEVLLFGYSVDGGEVKVIDIARGEKLPGDVQAALTDPAVTKWAFNAAFERVCISRFLGLDKGTYLDPKQWRCSMVWSAYLGLQLSLEGTGFVLGLDKQKLTEGKDLIRYFCNPCKATIANGGRTRNLPKHDIVKWEQFKAYNKRDVEVEMQIQNRLSNYPVPEFVWDEYYMDQEINDRGILTDMVFVKSAIRLDAEIKEKLMTSLKNITGLENPNSVVQFKAWLAEKGIITDSLDKDAVAELLKTAEGDVAKALKLRQQISKSSVKKYQAMENAACEDDRCRGMFMFYGANRTGRFAGRIVQLQNLPQNHLEELAEARAMVRCGDTDKLSNLYNDIPDTLSQLIRTAFIPVDGYKFFVADFSAIEARVIAWLAGEDWRTEVFKNGGDIYCASASQMFKVPVEKHGVNKHLRPKGKIAELALGYGGSVGALEAMGAIKMGLKEEELKPLVDVWRLTNPNIVRLWWDVDSAVKRAIRTGKEQTVKGIKFICKSGMLFITLPSGRNLCYAKPKVGVNMFGSESVTYEGTGSTKKWERVESYGPKFVENIIQAISRDILMHAIGNLKGYRIVGHVHDEVIIEAPPDTDLDEICTKMADCPSWADGLILRADGYICDFYMKS